MSAWTDHATKTYHGGKKKNPAYTFKDALKDAAKTYNKTTTNTNTKKKGGK